MRFVFGVLLCCLVGHVSAQLKPGFDPEEYAAILRISCYQVDVQFRGATPKETEYSRVYRSPQVGLHNKWDMWLSKNKDVMIVSIRGTTNDMDSWLENFYSAMVPASGSIKLDSATTFDYKFATDPKAMVHVGWTIGASSLLPDIMARIREYYERGLRQVIIAGHSQGGALAFLVTSHIRYQVEAGKLPRDLVFKTYCSAAPKPGNLYYAYDFDFITRGGWAYTVVNTADWVPETPVSVQTITDFNKINPFNKPEKMIQGQKLPVRMALKYVYRRLNKTSRKAQRTQQKYLGKLSYRQVKKFMPCLERSKFTNSNNYMRAGNPIVLQPDAAYFRKFPDSGDYVFRHHIFEPYYYLLKNIYR